MVLAKCPCIIWQCYSNCDQDEMYNAAATVLLTGDRLKLFIWLFVIN